MAVGRLVTPDAPKQSTGDTTPTTLIQNAPHNRRI